MSLVGVACCQVPVSATGRSLVQRSPTDYDHQKPQRSGGPGPRWALAPRKNERRENKNRIMKRGYC